MATLARGRLATNRIIYSRLAALNAPPYYFTTTPVCPVRAREPTFHQPTSSRKEKTEQQEEGGEGGRRGGRTRGNKNGKKKRLFRARGGERERAEELFPCRTAHPRLEDNQKCLISFSGPPRLQPSSPRPRLLAHLRVYVSAKSYDRASAFRLGEKFASRARTSRKPGENTM